MFLPERIILLCIYYLINLIEEAVTKNNTESFQVLQLQTENKWNKDQISHLQNKYNLDLVSIQSTHNKGSWEFLVKPEVLSDLAVDLDKFQIPYQVLPTDSRHGNFNDSFVYRRVRRKRRSLGHQEDLRHRFLTYEEIEGFLKFIQARSRSEPSIDVVVGSIGHSFEGRNTPYIIISNNKEVKKPLIFIDAGIHAREWISPAMAIEIIYQLAVNPDGDPEVDELLAMFDWVIVPLVNPDGYVYTFFNTITNRLWRKSRTTAYSNNPECYGVDLNRNFGFQWNDDPFFGGSNDPCSMTYSGPSSFSEPETRNLRVLLLSHRSSIKAYLSLHSFGQFFLYPWAFSSLVDLDDEKDLHHVASAFANTMKKKNYNYRIGGTAKMLYPAAGGSDDYVRGSLGVKYAYTIELPPHNTSRYGFLLPERDVKNVVTDTWDGLKALAFRLRGKLANETPGVNTTSTQV